MQSYNKVILIGNLGSDPEVKYTPGGKAVVNLSVATNRQWKEKGTGEAKEVTDWHRVVVWEAEAERCGKYLRKGSRVLVEGSLQTREYGEKQRAVEIVAARVGYLSGKEAGAPAGQDDAGGHGAAPVEDIPIPF